MHLREFLSSYEENQPDDVVVVDQVDIQYGPTIYAELLRRRNPLIIFESVKGYDGFRMCVNVFGTPKRIAYALSCKDERELAEKWHRMSESSSEPRFAEEGPVRDVVSLRDRLDVLSIPAPKHYAEDGGRYLSGALVAACKPDDPTVVNLSFARIQLLERDMVALSMHSRGHLWSYFQQYKERASAMPISIIVGTNPSLYLAGAARTENEYAKIVSEDDFELLRGLTNNVPVPADSEIVIEAEVLAGEEYDEGPFSEYTGYMSGRSTKNLARVSAISRRKDAIFLDITPSNSTEHVLLSSLAKELILRETLFQGLPPYCEYGASWPLSGTHYVAFASVGKVQPGLSKQVALDLIGRDHYLKIVIVNEGKADLTFFELLANAVARGENLPGKDIELLRDVFCNRLDPSSPVSGLSSKALWVVRGEGKYTLRHREDGIELEAGEGKIGYIGHNSISKDGEERWCLSILVDPDIDPQDEDQVLWGLATRCQPATDFHFRGSHVTIDCRKPEIARLKPTLPNEQVENVRSKLGGKKFSRDGATSP